MHFRSLKINYFIHHNNSNIFIDYINTNKLPQNHPCVIETIRKHFLYKPPTSDVPLKLDSNDMKDRSSGQTDVILKLLKNQVYQLTFFVS